MTCGVIVFFTNTLIKNEVPTTCPSRKSLVLDLAKRVTTVLQLANHVNIWSSINQKITCGIIVFIEIPLISLFGLFDLGAPLHASPTCQ
jgi:hypothetical protein